MVSVSVSVPVVSARPSWRLYLYSYLPCTRATPMYRFSYRMFIAQLDIVLYTHFVCLVLLSLFLCSRSLSLSSRLVFPRSVSSRPVLSCLVSSRLVSLLCSTSLLALRFPRFLSAVCYPSSLVILFSFPLYMHIDGCQSARAVWTA